eukprot:12682-Heterococcus_DN1.PRE.1
MSRQARAVSNNGHSACQRCVDHRCKKPWRVTLESCGKSAFSCRKTVFSSSRHSASLVHGIEATTSTSPAHQKIATIED